MLEAGSLNSHFKPISRREKGLGIAGESVLKHVGMIDLLGEKMQFGHYVAPNNNESAKHIQQFRRTAR